MNIKIVKAIKNEKRRRVFIEVIVDSKIKHWNVSKGLYKTLVELIGMLDLKESK
jgi:hypothetical protein